MRMFCAIDTVERSRDMIVELLRVVNPLIPLDKSQYQFLLGMDHHVPFDIEHIIASANGRSRDELEIRVPRVGRLTVDWDYAARKPSYQLIMLELNVNRSELGIVLRVLRNIVALMDARYAEADLERPFPNLPCEMKSGIAALPVYECLKDIFWYNFFGKELTEVLALDHRLDFRVPGVSVNRTRDSMEVIVDEGPRKRPYSPAIEEYIAQAGVFLRLNPRARFVRRIEFDYHKLKEP